MNEVQRTVASYLDLPKRIAKLEHQLANVSALFYASRSFTAGWMAINGGPAQKATGPEWGVITILTDEHSLIKRISRLTRRSKLFSDRFTREELRRLRRELLADFETSLTLEAYEHIQEVEYYLLKHAESRLGVEAMEGLTEEIKNLTTLENELEGLFGGDSR